MTRYALRAVYADIIEEDELVHGFSGPIEGEEGEYTYVPSLVADIHVVVRVRYLAELNTSELQLLHGAQDREGHPQGKANAPMNRGRASAHTAGAIVDHLPFILLGDDDGITEP